MEAALRGKKLMLENNLIVSTSVLLKIRKDVLGV
jgi:hypothetical protein